MKVRHFLFTLLVFSVGYHLSLAQGDLRLHYNQPARNWNEALPLGNGRLGAMVFGRVDEELIQLNEETLWSGGPANLNPNPQAPDYLPKIREALFAGDFETAEKLTQKLQGLFTESYLPLGDVVIKHDFPEGTRYEKYGRDLNISNATSTTQFVVDGTTFIREVFVSAPAQVIVIRVTASKPGVLNFTVNASSQLLSSTEVHGNHLIVSGKAPSHVDPSYQQSGELPVIYNDPLQCRGMRFGMEIAARPTDGSVTVTGNSLRVQNASDVMIIISAATSFNGYDKCPDKDGKDEKAIVKKHLEATEKSTFAELKRLHIDDYAQYFNRVSLSLGNPSIDLPTDERLRKYAEGSADPGLEELYFQYGRYLLISSSRPGGIPANLQGIWNHHLRAPWSSNYTTNINTEMNYWMVESCNLGELHEPLINLISQTSVTGKETAMNFYHANGWTLHHNTDIWATTNPVSGSPSWANWPMGAAWLSQHLWERYQFSADNKFLSKTAYPIMKSAAEFYVDWLIENKDGLLVTAPSTSPENIYVTDKGLKGSVSVATTMDMSLIWDLFTNVIHASWHLNIDEPFRNTLLEKRAKLFPLKVGKKGNLQEWSEDWEDADPQHRHISHLFGLFPGRQISAHHTPELAKAVRQSMDLRGDGGTGWSKGWKINIWARLRDGNRAYKLIREQLKLTGVEGTNYANGGGTYPNLLDAHPPFQIDGNFGGTSGMTEMLLQSHDEFVEVLPALPDAWTSGKVTGLKARGNFTIDIVWKNKKVTDLKVVSAGGGNLRLVSRFPLQGKGIQKASGLNSNPHFRSVKEQGVNPLPPGLFAYDLNTQPGQTYILKGR
ncbi:MAG TPA: glycoside hydrolase family 95 protein [Chryseosolibacter sp.]